MKLVAGVVVMIAIAMGSYALADALGSSQWFIGWAGGALAAFVWVEALA